MNAPDLVAGDFSDTAIAPLVEIVDGARGRSNGRWYLTPGTVEPPERTSTGATRFKLSKGHQLRQWVPAPESDVRLSVRVPVVTGQIMVGAQDNRYHAPRTTVETSTQPRVMKRVAEELVDRETRSGRRLHGHRSSSGMADLADGCPSGFRKESRRKVTDDRSPITQSVACRVERVTHAQTPVRTHAHVSGRDLDHQSTRTPNLIVTSSHPTEAGS
jgi:hypothetical protein